MTRTLLVLAVGTMMATLGRGDDTKEKAVKFDQATGYFESNKTGLEGESSYLTFSNQAAFAKVLRPTPPLMAKKPKLLPENVFDKHVVLAVIKRGDSLWQYKVEKVQAQTGTLTVEYSAVQQGGGGSAKFASPLVIAVEKGDYKEVVFVENGKKAGTVKFDK